MSKIQVGPIPESEQSHLTQLTRDFRAALSYVSFYSADSTFVVQAVQKLYKDFQRLLQAVDPLVFHLPHGSLFLNDRDLSDFTELLNLLKDKNMGGLQITSGLAQAELTQWLRSLTLPFAKAAEEPEKAGPAHIHPLSAQDSVEIIASETIPAVSPAEILFPISGDLPTITIASISLNPFPSPSVPDQGPSALNPILKDSELEIEVSSKTNEAMLSFIAEAWQYSQLQKKNIGAGPEMAGLTRSFDQLFSRLLDRMEKTSPEFKSIYQWFKSPPGDLMEGQVVMAMYPLIEVAVKNDWTAVLFDPATEGLISDCLTNWGATGKHDLVEKTVACLADSLSGDRFERELGLTHLMDARPWIRNPKLLEKVLEKLNALLATESTPGVYQTALLLAWDLLEPAMEMEREQTVLTLLSTLHFHADEDVASFPERAKIARHWLFERSTPELIRHLVSCAHKAGQLNHFPLLGEMAAPVLLKNFLAAPSTERPDYLQLFNEIKEPTRSVLAEALAEAQDEAAVAVMIPILRGCAVDTGLSLQLCSWVAKGSRELKLNLIGMIEEVGDPAGGPALRLALLDDAEEIASLAARVIGKIHFIPGIPVLLKAAKMRETRFPNNEVYLVSVCQALGDLAQPETLSFLLDIARKKSLLRGKNFSLAVRLEAIRAITRINQPEAWHFVESLMEEKNPALQEALEKIIHERSGNLS